jgi:hypothetical protein
MDACLNGGIAWYNIPLYRLQLSYIEAPYLLNREFEPFAVNVKRSFAKLPPLFL